MKTVSWKGAKLTFFNTLRYCIPMGTDLYLHIMYPRDTTVDSQVTSYTRKRIACLPFINQTLQDHRFTQDNDPKHTSRRARAFFEENDINWWRTRQESPDLNPIDILWHELKFYLESKVKPRNKQELVDGIKAFWAERVTEEKCAKYIDHVLMKVVPAVLEAKGAGTQF